MTKRLRSVFTKDMNSCFFTGSIYIERHHIFGGANRKKSEKYGFIVPLRYDLHPNGSRANHAIAHDIDTYLKTMAQRYYEEHIGTRECFISEFGKNWIQ